MKSGVSGLRSIQLTGIVLSADWDVPDGHNDAARYADQADDDEYDPTCLEVVTGQRDRPDTRHLHRVPPHGNRVQLRNTPHGRPIRIIQTLQPELEVIDARNADQHPDVDVDDHVQGGVLDCAPERLRVDRVDVNTTETPEAHLCNLLVLRSEPECERAVISLGWRDGLLGLVGEVRDHQWADKRKANGHDAVDDERPLSTGDAVLALETLVDRRLQRSRQHGSDRLARVVEADTLGHLQRSVPCHLLSVIYSEHTH